MKHPRWILSAVVILLLAYAASKVDWRTAASIMRRAQPAPLVAATVINLLSLSLRGVRWWIFLRRVGAGSLGLAVRGAIVGSGFNNLLIAGGGDAARAVLVSRASGVARTPIFATVALEALFDPLCFGLLLFLGTFAVPLPASLSGIRAISGIGLVAVLAFLAVLVRAPASHSNALVGSSDWRSRIRAFRLEVQGLSTSRRFAAALLASIGIWGLQLAAFTLVARSVGVEMPLAGTVAALLLTNAGLVLRATPGNIGFFQFAYALAASRFGVPTHAAVASALLLQIVQIVPVTLLAVGLAPRMLKQASRAR